MKCKWRERLAFNGAFHLMNFSLESLKEQPFTRRGVLSTIASVFEFVAPFILVGKKILQQLCHDKISWDDLLPSDLHS